MAPITPIGIATVHNPMQIINPATILPRILVGYMSPYPTLKHNQFKRKSNLNLIGNVNDCKNVKKDQPDIKPNIETLNHIAQSTKTLPQSTPISNLNKPGKSVTSNYYT